MPTIKRQELNTAFWEATNELRWLYDEGKEFRFPNYTLQQMYINRETGEQRWINVPIVNKNI